MLSVTCNNGIPGRRRFGSQLLPVNVPGQVAKDGVSAWATAPTRETRGKLLAAAWPALAVGSHLGSEPGDGRCFSLLFLSLPSLFSSAFLFSSLGELCFLSKFFSFSLSLFKVRLLGGDTDLPFGSLPKKPQWLVRGQESLI